MLKFTKAHLCFFFLEVVLCLVLTADKIRLLTQAEVQAYIRLNERTDPHKLALQRSRFEGLESRDISNQVAALQKARLKIPNWAETIGVVFPEPVSMEQCSSQLTAFYKTKFIGPDNSVTDLTGGLGIDSWAMATAAASLNYVERQDYLCGLAKVNFSRLGLNKVNIFNQELEEYLLDWEKDPTDLVFCDPARRNENQRKVFLLEHCSPDIGLIYQRILDKGADFLIKLSPMFDIVELRKRLGKHLREIHVVAVKNECKELLILLKPEQGDCLVKAVNLGSTDPDFIVDADALSANVVYSEPETFLFEANSAIMKTGKQDQLLQTFSLKKLAEHSHLYTTTKASEHFPGRSFIVKAVYPLDKKLLKESIPGGKANITVRNFPMKPEEVAKKLGFTFGGDQFLFATTLNDGRKVIIHCEKLSSI